MIRMLIGIVIGAVIVVFAAQNAEVVSYSFLWWTVTAPRVLVLLAVFLTGMITSWLIVGLSRISRRRRK